MEIPTLTTITLRFKADTDVQEEDNVVRYKHVSKGRLLQNSRRAAEWRNRPGTNVQTSHDNDNILQRKSMDCSQSKPVTTAVFTTTTTTQCFQNVWYQLVIPGVKQD